MKNKNNVNPLLHALLPVVITIAYIVIGFLFDSGWAIGWIMFLLIPIVETLINAIKTKNPSHFAYPVLVTAVFLFTGMMWGLWHPMWVLFVTIPAYYAICDAVKKQYPKQSAENQQPNNSAQEGVYYQPPENQAPRQSRGGVTAVIITAIVSVAAIIIVAIVCTFAWLGGSFNSPAVIGKEDTSTSYVQGPYNISPDGIEMIDIEWVSGNVDVQYYDGETIYLEESTSSEKYPLKYAVEGRTLKIDEYADNASFSFAGKYKKDLLVKLPNDFKTQELSLEVVSADVTVSQLKTSDFELNCVSGNINVSFEEQPKNIDLETVSGNVNLAFPDSITGYSVKSESVSGKVNTNDFDNMVYYGDGYTLIDFEGVSGNLTLEKVES